MSKSIRVACAGTGYFSRFQYRAWMRIPEVNLVALCNRTHSKAAVFAADYAIPSVYSDVESMLAAEKLDLLDVITPPETHLAAIRAAAAHGVDVICQKPFCGSLAEAVDAVALSEACGVSLVIHENFRFQPWYRTIRAVLASGRLGRVYQATFRLRPGDGQGADAYMERQPYFQSMPRFLVHETAIHFIDVFRFLFGETLSVTASLRKLNPAIAGEDAGLFVLDMRSGVRCVFDGNRLSDHRARNRRLTMGEMTIEGEKGVLSLDGDAALTFRAHGSNDQVAVDFSWNDIDFGGDCVYRFQRHVIDHRLGRGPIENCAQDYLANIKVEAAVYASNDSGCRIILHG